MRKFNLPHLVWNRRQDMYRKLHGKWWTEAQLRDPAILKSEFHFNGREAAFLAEHNLPDLASLYFEPYLAKFTDEFQPFGVGYDHLDAVTLGDFLAQEIGRAHV